MNVNLSDILDNTISGVIILTLSIIVDKVRDIIKHKKNRHEPQ